MCRLCCYHSFVIIIHIISTLQMHVKRNHCNKDVLVMVHDSDRQCVTRQRSSYVHLVRRHCVVNKETALISAEPEYLLTQYLS